MIKEYRISGFYLLIVLICIIIIPSCTYDYFEDETNYVIYVPKADKNVRTDTYSIEDLTILIYDGDLKKEKYSFNPFSENGRSMVGNFNFRLYPSTYSIYCFTNVQETNFIDLNSHNVARFDLKQSTDGFYEEPSAIYLEHKTPTITFPGPVITDTAWFETNYVGRICVAFKNLTKIDASLTYSNIKRIDIEAEGIGVKQLLSRIDIVRSNTRSSRHTPQDKMRLTSEPFNLEYKDFEFGIQNNYYPSPDLSEEEGGESEPITLNLKFIGQNDNQLSTLRVPIIDRQGNPMLLEMGETLVVEVDGNNIQILRLDNLEEWKPDIDAEDNSNPSGGGIHI